MLDFVGSADLAHVYEYDEASPEQRCGLVRLDCFEVCRFRLLDVVTIPREIGDILTQP